MGLTARERLEQDGYEDVVIFDSYSYDSALIGITVDNRAVYDYDLMIEWLEATEGFSEDEAVDWLNYNTIGASYAGPDGPLIMYRLQDADWNN